MKRKIKNYTINQYITKGSYGKVYLVQSENQQPYALKYIQLQQISLEEAQKEVHIHATLNHPNIVKFKESFVHQQTNQQTNHLYLVIVLEYCPGGQIYDFIGSIKRNESLKIMKHTLEAIVYLHNQNIIHRDIKLSNILLNQGVYKICDFGTSTIMNLSGEQTPIGTESYRAPEMYRSEKYSTKVDVWSLGIVFLEIQLGSTIRKFAEGIPAQIQDFPSQTLLQKINDAKIRELIVTMLKKNPEQRLTSQQALDWMKRIQILSTRQQNQKQIVIPQQKDENINPQLQNDQNILKKAIPIVNPYKTKMKGVKKQKQSFLHLIQENDGHLESVIYTNYENLNNSFDQTQNSYAKSESQNLSIKPQQKQQRKSVFKFIKACFSCCFLLK